MRKKILWVLFAVLSVVFGLYPVKYFLITRKPEVIGAKPDFLMVHVLWDYVFYTHIILGGIALLIGWIQFHSKHRNQHLMLHRKIGKVYVVSVLLSAVSSLYIAMFVVGGFWSAFGFICLGIIWFYTTLRAYLSIRNRNLEQHRRMMIYSYALCFAAVTLRLWLPLLIVVIGDYTTAYMIVAWWAWIPNLIVAFFLARRVN
ncbi:DUF2306 domain-containing protein [Pedobacter sp. FW305-3-2-15-E-R2A2]|uniref:DUF2306 domain-containing protein n=1 Tax=Pedobacter sp. FW305-3-2-15-E-R2A2 TaxID=3140251 RepID=UPI0031402465